MSIDITKLEWQELPASYGDHPGRISYVEEVVNGEAYDLEVIWQDYFGGCPELVVMSRHWMEEITSSFEHHHQWLDIIFGAQEWREFLEQRFPVA